MALRKFLPVHITINEIMHDSQLLDIGDITRIVGRIKMHHSAIPIFLRVREVSEGFEIEAVWNVPDRDTGELIEVATTRACQFHPALDADMIIGKCEDLIREAFDHEFREAFHIDGRRIYDPHANV